MNTGLQKENGNHDLFFSKYYFSNTTLDHTYSQGMSSLPQRNKEVSSSIILLLNKITKQAKLIHKFQIENKKLKKLSQQEYLAFKTINEEINTQVKETKNKLREAQDQIPTQDKTSPDLSKRRNPKILIYGVSSINKMEIIQMIKNKLSVSYNIELKDSDFSVLISNKKSELKNTSPAEQLKSGMFDYLIVGPHPHSVKGKNIKHSWQLFLETKKIQTKAFEIYHKPLSKARVLVVANKIGEEWFNKAF